MGIIYCSDQPNYHTGKGAGLESDIKSEDLSPDYTFYSPGHWTCSFVCYFNSTESIQSCSHFAAHCTYRTHCYLYPNWYSFSPESNETFEGEVPCLRTQHRNIVPRLRGEKHDFSQKILHQAGFETARQGATLSKRHALTIAPCPSL